MIFVQQMPKLNSLLVESCTMEMSEHRLNIGLVLGALLSPVPEIGLFESEGSISGSRVQAKGFKQVFPTIVTVHLQ